jgi:hypothetical protein
MSDHELPLDPASWPTDPYRLLGVSRTVSKQDLRKAYLKLIRAYKPEHHPDEFQKIRQAYETLQPLAGQSDAFRDPIGDEVEISFSTGPEPEPRLTPAEPSVDPWELACAGEPESSYRMLLMIPESGNPAEETYLQLYWLLVLVPGLDPARQPIDWLISGLARLGPRAGRLRELLRRELSADLKLALSDRIIGFFQRSVSLSLVHDVLLARWRAARLAKRWSLIVADVDALRGWLPGVDSEAWAGILLAASMNLGWAGKPENDRVVGYCREVEQLGHRSQDFGEELYQVEYVQILRSGLDRLNSRMGAFSEYYPLLSCSWDERSPQFEGWLRSYIEQIARDPRTSLDRMDRIQKLAPAVLGRLSTLLGGLDFEDQSFHTSRIIAEITPALGRFLAEHHWNDYKAIRLDLLRFCLKEAISPALMARTLSERPEFVLTGKSPLAQSIRDDLPLRHVYRAFELSWSEPASNLF